GEVRQKRPVAYQQVDGARRPVDAAFAVSGTRVGFTLGTFDRSRALVIDPTLAYSTFLGGVGEDEGRAVTVDGTGAAYVTGRTAAPDFPTVPAQPENTASVAYVSKLSPDGSALVYSSYFGGTGGDTGTGIALHDGTAYVTGTTSSTDFPTTPGAFRRACGIDGACAGGGDAFVTTFGPTGPMAYSTYLGGRGDESGNAIAVDANGRAYVTGATRSASFPTTAGALATRCGSDGTCYANATFTDGVSSDASTTFTSASAGFTGDDVGKEISGANIPASTTIAAVADSSTVTLSQPATAAGSGLTFSIANATFTDGASTEGSTTYTSALPHFVAADAGHPISGDNIPEGTTVAAFVGPTEVTLSQPATATGSLLAFTIARATFTDGASTIGTPYYTSASASFTEADVGRPISGTNIPDGTTV
ncbi:MAG: SBBP repeat-containing protein, partial [Acidimicrobiales bacterium]